MIHPIGISFQTKRKKKTPFPLHLHYNNMVEMPRLLVLGLFVCESFPRPAQHVMIGQSQSMSFCHVQMSFFFSFFLFFYGGRHLRGKLSKFVTDHVLCYPHIGVDLAIVDLEDEADKVGQDGGTAGLRLDRRCALAQLWSHDWKAARIVRASGSSM